MREGQGGAAALAVHHLDPSIEHVPDGDSEVKWRGESEESCEPFDGIKRSDETPTDGSGCMREREGRRSKPLSQMV
jgi:hypothetical protein